MFSKKHLHVINVIIYYIGIYQTVLLYLLYLSILLYTVFKHILFLKFSYPVTCISGEIINK